MTSTASIRTVVLCGGEGVRLQPLTLDCPKPLVPLRGLPIINYVVGHLHSHNLHDITIAGGYKVNMLESHFAGSTIKVIDTGTQDIVKRICQLDDGLMDEMLVLYGDTLSDVNIPDLIRDHRRSLREATVTVWPLRSSFGVFELNSNCDVRSYKEKPVLDHWINIGYFIFSRRALGSLKNHSTFQGALTNLVERGELHAYRHHGLHITVNTRAELEDAESALSRWPSVG